MAKETTKKAVAKQPIRKPRISKKAMALPADTIKATTETEGVALNAKTAAGKESNAVMVYDHVAKVERKMSKRQFDILSTTTYTEGRSKYKRYTLGNVKKAAITKND
jgi:hypothetical protein